MNSLVSLFYAPLASVRLRPFPQVSAALPVRPVHSNLNLYNKLRQRGSCMERTGSSKFLFATTTSNQRTTCVAFVLSFHGCQFLGMYWFRLRSACSTFCTLNISTHLTCAARWVRAWGRLAIQAFHVFSTALPHCFRKACCSECLFATTTSNQTRTRGAFILSLRGRQCL
jgi:hypothetical protein